MTKVTKTISPLHFEDLEPHRFEDLVRQLIYDFRDWKSLEATGRLGSDEGFDVRGWEVLPSIEPIDEEEENSVQEDRIWLIQCKREKSIAPKKIQRYAEEIISKTKEPLYGVILVAPCDFSKKTRDVFIEKIRKHGVREFRLWGRAELEDILFQPKNDHLLFAYFGISLSIRRRSLKTQIRTRLTIKRKAIRCLGDVKGHSHRPILLRDPEEFRYPYKEDIPDFDKFPRWIVRYFVGHHHNGLEFITRKFFAYLADDKVHWDAVEEINDAKPPDDPWTHEDKTENDKRHAVRCFWNDIPERNRASLEVVRVVPYDKILDIDEEGDIYFSEPHIYVPFNEKDGPFEPGVYVTLSTITPFRSEIYPQQKNKIKFFPDTFPDPKKGQPNEQPPKQST